jgi:hypothetical protein
VHSFHRGPFFGFGVDRRVITPQKLTRTCTQSPPCPCSPGIPPRPARRQQRQQQPRHRQRKHPSSNNHHLQWIQTVNKGPLLLVAGRKRGMAEAARQRRKGSGGRRRQDRWQDRTAHQQQQEEVAGISKASCRPLKTLNPPLLSPFGPLSSSTPMAGCRGWGWT